MTVYYPNEFGVMGGLQEYGGVFCDQVTRPFHARRASFGHMIMVWWTGNNSVSAQTWDNHLSNYFAARANMKRPVYLSVSWFYSNLTHVPFPPNRTLPSEVVFTAEFRSPSIHPVTAQEVGFFAQGMVQFNMPHANRATFSGNSLLSSAYGYNGPASQLEMVQRLPDHITFAGNLNNASMVAALTTALNSGV